MGCSVGPRVPSRAGVVALGGDHPAQAVGLRIRSGREEKRLHRPGAAAVAERERPQTVDLRSNRQKILLIPRRRPLARTGQRPPFLLRRG